MMNKKDKKIKISETKIRNYLDTVKLSIAWSNYNFRKKKKKY